MDPLTPTQRRELRAKAHHLEPVVIVGHHGLTPPVLHEIDLALIAHELVKVRVLGDDRDAREALLAQACAALDCAEVQHVGKVLVLWRPNPEKKKEKAAPVASPRTKQRKDIGTRGLPKKTGARTPLDPVRERRRATQGNSAGASNKGRRGAARNAPPVDDRAEAGPASPPAGRKPAYAPKANAKVASAKPDQRSSRQRRPAAGDAGPPAGGARRRRTAG